MQAGARDDGARALRNAGSGAANRKLQDIRGITSFERHNRRMAWGAAAALCTERAPPSQFPGGHRRRARLATGATSTLAVLAAGLVTCWRMSIIPLRKAYRVEACATACWLSQAAASHSRGRDAATRAGAHGTPQRRGCNCVRAQPWSWMHSCTVGLPPAWAPLACGDAVMRRGAQSRFIVRRGAYNGRCWHPLPLQDP